MHWRLAASACVAYTFQQKCKNYEEESWSRCHMGATCMQARFKAEPQTYNLVNNDQCTAFSIVMAA